MTIKDRANFHRLCLMYTCKYGLTPEYLSDKITIYGYYQIEEQPTDENV